MAAELKPPIDRRPTVVRPVPMMALPDGDAGWFTRERLLTLTLAFVTLLFVYLCYRIVLPFIPPIAFAVALAVATHRPYVWIRNRFQGDAAAAAIAVLLVTLLIVGPAVILGNYIVGEGVENLNELRERGLDWRAAIGESPQLAEAFDWAEQRLDFRTQLQNLTGSLATRATDFLRGTITVLTQLVVTLFVLFFLYRDGRQAVEALYEVVPLSQDEARVMFSRLANTIRATVNGSVTIASIQAILASIMYLILGVPAAVLWGAVTFIAALIPVFGTFLVWGPIAIYLVITGSWIKAAVLVGWGVLAVGTIDNILYPFLVGDKLRIHTVPTFFAILGGIALFGPVGLIMGPLVLAITIGLLDIWWWRTAGGRPAEQAVDEAAPTTPPSQTLVEQR